MQNKISINYGKGFRLATMLFSVFLVSSWGAWADSKSPLATPMFSENITIESVRTAWPTAPDSKGGWSTIGEVVIKNSGVSTIKIKRIVADFKAGYGKRLSQDILRYQEFKDRLFVYDATAGLFEKAGTFEIKPGEEAVALLSSLVAPGAPTNVTVKIQFVDGSDSRADVPIIDYSNGPKLRFPLAIPMSQNIKWVPINGFDTLYHRTAFVPTATDEHFFAQRYAANFVMGNIHTQQPAPIGATTKEQHYAWNRKVISASAGTVVAAEDGNPDMELGINDFDHPLGNHVVIRHPDGVYLMYGHLRNGSIQVQTGDVVEVGQNLGRVGSSGQTDIPTLHFQVSDTWEGPDDVSRFGNSQGLPMLIEGINILKERGLVPLKGVQMMDRDIVESKTMESIR